GSRHPVVKDAIPEGARSYSAAFVARPRRIVGVCRPGLPYTQRRMLEQAKTRALPVVTRAADLAPAAQACCGVCRTCAATNVVGVALAALGGLALSVRRFARRSRVSDNSTAEMLRTPGDEAQVGGGPAGAVTLAGGAARPPSL